MKETGIGVIELRQYTFRAEGRDAFIDLFDRHFIESQERDGMTVLGQFRDTRRPERFVWLRGFPDMEARHRSLEKFYGGPVWAEHRDAANTAMLEFHDVLLLRPARPGSGMAVDFGRRPAPDAAAGPGGIVLVGIHLLQHPADEEVLQLFEREAFPVLRAAGVRLLGFYVTEETKNTFRLPVREGENAAVWIGTVPYERARIGSEILTGQAVPGTLLELAPTRRSLLRHGIGEAQS
jgi:hypothetical protein